ncbi:TATA box-binding protein-associated factor RNA polymerase I subunit B isoform X2 [Betta splendens]|nr:TATA box-binding protein-associated factor RNA polymerase I subunit B isoform X2 [Betta splendens]
MVCEGFQFILMKQANALVQLGVSPQFKDKVLCQLWRLYLQRSRQAYTHNPVRSSKFKLRSLDSDSDSAAESAVTAFSETDGDANLSSTAGSNAESSSGWSQFSGSVDARNYLGPRMKRNCGLMSMKKTLALIHLALVWSREPLTLSDLLRFATEGHVPYLNAYEELPEEMKLDGKDGFIFRVESIPSHHTLHKEAQTLLLFLQLPAFPPISRQSLLHPALLSLRYLMDANLPDELHPWVCQLLERAGMAEHSLHTFDPVSHPLLPRFDLQSVALIIVTLKVLFGLDDHTEWDLSNVAGDHGDSENMFSLRRWYRLMQAALITAQQRRNQHIARKQWKAKKPLSSSKMHINIVMKQKRTAEQVQACFQKLSSCPVGVQPAEPSSFRFCWGDEDGADGPSLHHQKLDSAVTLSHNVHAASNSTYWHPALRACDPGKCRNHYPEVEASLPRSLVWLLQLFSFMLDVTPACLYEEVLGVERRVFGTKTPNGCGAEETNRTDKKTRRKCSQRC